MMQTDEQFMRYFPSKMAKGRVPDREYFFTVLNTVYPEHVRKMIEHAQAQRFSA